MNHDADFPAPASAPASLRAFPLRRGYNPLARRVEHRDGFPVFPGHFPVLGHMPAYAVDLLALMRDAERALGPMFFLKMGFGLWVLFYTRPEAFSLFKNKVTSSDYLREGGTGMLLGESVFVQDGAPHRHMRGALNGPFQPKGLGEAHVGTLVADLVERRVATWVGRRDVRRCRPRDSSPTFSASSASASSTTTGPRGRSRASSRSRSSSSGRWRALKEATGYAGQLGAYADALVAAGMRGAVEIMIHLPLSGLVTWIA
jgi:hypothetical protein